MRRLGKLAAVLMSAAVVLCGAASAQTLKVGSKNFTEQFIVAELYAASLEAAGFKVERKINLGATLVAHEALRTGAIDLYPEYTGTGLGASPMALSDAIIATYQMIHMAQSPDEPAAAGSTRETVGAKGGEIGTCAIGPNGNP